MRKALYEKMRNSLKGVEGVLFLVERIFLAVGFLARNSLKGVQGIFRKPRNARYFAMMMETP